MAGWFRSAPRSRWLVLGFVEFAIAIAILVLPLTMGRESTSDLAPLLLWSGLMAASLIVRRAWPLISIFITAAGTAGLLLTTGQALPAVVIVLPIMYSAARYGGARASVAAWLLGLATAVAAPLIWMDAFPRNLQFLIATLLTLLCLACVLCAWLIGRMVDMHARTSDMGRVLAEQAFRHRALTSQQETQLVEDRARSEVARELHDVVAHSLSIIVVQAEGAKALFAKRPEAAQNALDVIATTGRTSINEMRRIVGLLRGETDATFGPTPSLAQIPEMVAAAGDRIILDVPEELPAVPESIGLAAFRVVQESVTNFLKHAGPKATAKARVDVSPTEITILVTDDGLGSQAVQSPHPGAGLKGMEERVHAMGGTLSAGPRSGGGYQVKAVIPRAAQLGQGWMTRTGSR